MTHSKLHYLAESSSSQCVEKKIVGRQFQKVLLIGSTFFCEEIGVRGRVLDWIAEWLNERKQRVVINWEASEWEDVLSGVPQGSILGPLLVLVYINDIDNGLLSLY